MPVLTDRSQAVDVIDELRDKNVSMAIFCTASHWNTEAILLAANRFAEENGIERIPLAIAMTYTYPYMPQACRVTYGGNPRDGFLSNLKHLEVLCGEADSTYSRVVVLPHLDHADPNRDRWALTEGSRYLASVMFDAQKYPYEQNRQMTREYVETYGKQVLIEGIIEELSVQGNATGKGDKHYIEKALDHRNATGIDFLVADLGTEQQSSAVGRSVYQKDRARQLTAALGQSMLVLHGTSCLNEEQMIGLADDGIIRVNMWTRIAREAGQYAAENVVKRIDRIRAADFEATESRAYFCDSVEQAARVMQPILGLLGYGRLSASGG